MWKCDRRIWKGKDGKFYEDGDERARVLALVPGDEVRDKPQVEPLAGEKKAKSPGENKALKPGENKGGKKDSPDPFPASGDEEDAED